MLPDLLATIQAQDTVFVQVAESYSRWKYVLDSAGLVGAAAVVITLLVTMWRLKLFVEHARSEGTFKMIARWNSPEFVHARKPIVTFLKMYPSDTARLQVKVNAEEDFRANLHMVLNFFEELGLAWKERQIDRDLCKEFFAAMIIKYYEEFQTFISDRRNRYQRPSLWEHFKALYDGMQ